MKYLLLSLVMVTTISCASSAKKLNNISDLRWKYRVILLLSSEDDTRNQQLFTKYNEAVLDRHIVWFIVKDRQVISNYSGGISEQFVDSTKDNFPLDKYPVLLIGKDGGIKTQADTFELQLLFSNIDLMPMRQQEMSRNK